MALGNITFGQGFASGIDFRSIVDAIIKAQSAPVEKMQSRVAMFQSAKKSFGSLSTLLNEFKSSLEALKGENSVGGKKVTLSGDSDTPSLSATASSSAAEGSYEVTVTAIAQAHRVRSTGLDDRYSPLVADGQITIQAGGYDEITVDVSAANGNNSLSAIAAAINAADEGVLASVVSDGTKSILVVKAQQTGSEHELTISDTTNLDLDLETNLLQAAQDAELTVDGIEVTSSINQVASAIEGVTLNLTKATTGPVTITVENDIEGTKEAIRELVASYNKINDFFQDHMGSAASESTSAIASSSSLRNVQSRIQSLLTGSLTGIGEGKIDSLALLGIQIADSTGTLEFDEEVFDDLVDLGRFDEIRAVLLSSGGTNDSSVVYLGGTAATQAGSYAVQVTQAAERATVLGAAAIQPAGLAQAETLTFTMGADTATVDLAAGDTLAAVITKINSGLRTAGINIFAEDNGGALQLRSREYGAEASFSVVSDVADPADGTTTGIGTTLREDAGVDVAGSIDGEAATGVGQVLMGAEDTDVEGLRIQVYATAESVAAKAGDFGEVYYSQGAGDRFIEGIKNITDPYEGLFKSINDSYDMSIRTMNDKITEMEERLAMREELLVRQFSAAEQAISQLNAMLAQLGSR